MTTPVHGGKSSGDSSRSVTPLHLFGILLAAITGTVHLGLGVTEGSPALFVAGIGFAVGILAVIVDVRRHMVVRLGIPFTAVQTVYYLATHYEKITWVSAMDKLVQIALITVLIGLYRRD